MNLRWDLQQIQKKSPTYGLMLLQLGALGLLGFLHSLVLPPVLHFFFLLEQYLRREGGEASILTSERIFSPIL